MSSYVPRSVPHSSTKGRISTVDTTPSKSSRPANGNVHQPAGTNSVAKPPSRSVGASKTYAPRSSKPRPAIVDAFKKPAFSNEGFDTDAQNRRDISSISTDSGKSTNSESLPSTTSQISSRASVTINEEWRQPKLAPSPSTKPSSSAALREVIAKAKADRRKAAESQWGGAVKSENVLDDPLMSHNNKGQLRKRIDMARTDGRLNIAAMGLTEFPEEVLNMYNVDALNASGTAWYESVDITRLIAADNQFQTLDDKIFPDQSAEELANEDEETKGALFGALEVLDLHGNLLEAVPRGLRQLERLTVLNVSKNRLTSKSIETIAQIRCLTELRMAENDLRGALPQALFGLEYLEVLDLHGNAISDVSEKMLYFANLKFLDVSDNQLGSLCFEFLRALPLTELNAAKNKLAGTLLPEGFDGFSSLKAFDVSGNVLTCVSHDIVNLPMLQTFNVSANRLTELPNMSGWTELTTLSAANNNIGAIPEGFTSLSKLRNVDLTGNNFKKLDDRLGMMETLTTLSVSNNPLRDRRFLTMSTDHLKQELRNRLLPAEPDDASSDAYITVDTVSQVILEAPSTWSIKPGGILDRSYTSLQEIDSAHLQPLLDTRIKSFILHHNLLPSILPTISLLASTLTSLDISHNKMSGFSYLSERLSLPLLREINLASNTITSLTPLMTHLSAPLLQSLNISYNRITALPVLRHHYPSLTTILASDNSIVEIPVESAKGLHVLDVSRNDIAHLEPRLGLLEADGLRMFGVEGNRFRVPRREVVEKGSGAVLEWLRGRIAER